MAEKIIWPSIPDGLKYVELRLPGTFRELLANPNFSHEEIGQIMRCIALDTDLFLTRKIEPEVIYYRGRLIEKNRTRLRVEAHRKRKLLCAAGQLSAEMENPSAVQRGVTVTPQDREPVEYTLLSRPKTPSIITEKTPPIVPLEKNPSSSLESTAHSKLPKSREERIKATFQDNLFALAGAGGVAGQIVESSERRSGSLVGALSASRVSADVQDIGRAPTPVSGGLDARTDAAWIPERFATFWAKYPRHIGKASALKAFTKLIKSQKDVEKFMKTTLSSIDWWMRQDSWTKDNGKYIPYPASWLNRGSWEDAADNANTPAKGSAEFLNTSSESDEELLRRMQGGG